MTKPSRSDRALPASLTTFIGRRRESAEVRRLLESSRLLTLTGPGGIGKTRLALHTARSMHRAFPDGIWSVELDTLTDPSLLPQTISAAIGLPDVSNTARMEALINYLSERDGLLILDNCEHLVASCAQLVRALLRASQGLRILTTSRQPLGVEGEQAFEVPPLSVPEEGADSESAQALQRYESVNLFLDRARSIIPGFKLDTANHQAVARLCLDLEGVPLAIELAAVRLRLLSVDQIAARLDDRFRLLSVGHRASAPRQTSLTAMVEWSYELLDQPDRMLWARLSVFAGGFDLAAVEAVCCDDDLPVESLLDRLHSLVERSIVVRDEVETGIRYRMLETLRQFGRAHLTSSDELENMRARHRDWYGALAKEAIAGWTGAEELEWNRRLKAERHNIRAAIEYSLTVPDQAIRGLRMAVNLRYFWLVHGISEGRRHAERLLAALPRGEDADKAKVRGHWLAGWLAFYQGDIEATRRHGEESTALAERLDDTFGRAYATYLMGLVAACDHDYERVKTLMSKARDLHEETGDLAGAWLATSDLAGALGARGEKDTAIDLCRLAIGQCVEHGARWFQSYLQWTVADLLRMQGNHNEATRLLESTLKISLDFEDQMSSGSCLESLSWLAGQREDAASAAWLLGAAHATWGNAGISLLRFAEWGNIHEQTRAHACRSLGEESFNQTYRRGTRMTPTEAINSVLRRKTPATSPRGPETVGGIEDLTPRELQIARLISQGLTNKKIAQQLVIAQRTAEGHVENILRKLSCNSRAQVAAWMSRATDGG
ncbi:LuxR C-terminal-related transcriptional regulator [Streptosporangium sp. NBC_01495]|uniref:LuxR C-terminal-related transcriptional regulator n=1 Tax=Streptosporangium sp. NBC_01495 TaxID=2903899 RepID=UPI002E315907|nr:LuxR C-terminal-related transcriptional regulator [Streptosporangium sp. NBC_01495]